MPPSVPSASASPPTGTSPPGTSTACAPGWMRPLPSEVGAGTARLLPNAQLVGSLDERRELVGLLQRRDQHIAAANLKVDKHLEAGSLEDLLDGAGHRNADDPGSMQHVGGEVATVARHITPLVDV